MDPSWTMDQNYHVNATANNNNNNNVDVMYPTPESGSHHHPHQHQYHRQLPTFHKILNNSNINGNMHHGYHRKYPPTTNNGWNPDTMIRIQAQAGQAKPEFGSRLFSPLEHHHQKYEFDPMDSRFQNVANDEAAAGDTASSLDYYQPSSDHRPFRQRSSLNNVDQYYHHHDQQQQQQRKNPTSRRHSSTTSSILDVPSIVHRDGANLRFGHRDTSSSPNRCRRGSSSIFHHHHVQPQSQSKSTMIGDPDDSRMVGVATVDGQHFVSKTGGSNNNNQNNNGNLARHSPLHQHHQQQQQQSLGVVAAVTSSSSSSSSSTSSMIMAPFSSQAENRAFHHHHHQQQQLHNNNHNHHNLHHLQQQQIQFDGLQPCTSSMYSSSTSSLQTTTNTSTTSSSITSAQQTGPGGTGNGNGGGGGGNGLGQVSPRNNNNNNGYCNGPPVNRSRQSSSSSTTILIDAHHQCSNTVTNHSRDNDFDADNDGGGGSGKTSSFHLRVNSPDVRQDDDDDDDDDEQIVVQLNHNPSIPNNTSNNNSNNKNQNHHDDVVDHNHLHVPNHYINCDDDLLEEVDEAFQQNHRAVRRHRSLPAPTFSMSSSSSWNSVKPHPRSSSFRIRTTNRGQSATRIQEPNGYWRVQVKKSKPYLGIAIEGGSNVSAQSQPRIINIQEDGAANVEGLHVGHIIMEVDGKTTNFMNHGQVAQMIARAYYNTPEKDYVEFLVREKSRNEFDLRRSSFMLLNSSYE